MSALCKSCLAINNFFPHVSCVCDAVNHFKKLYLKSNLDLDGGGSR